MTSAWAAIAAGVVLLLVAAARRGDLAAALPDAGPVDLGDGQAEQGQGGAALDVSAALANIDPITIMSDNTATQGDDNLAAFLAMIRRAEGTYGPDAYRMMFGRRLFTSFADHPRQPAQFTTTDGQRLWTSAAGAYQFMAVSPIPTGGWTRVDTWDRLAAKLQLPDFSPASQDQAATQLIADAGALGDVRAGRFDAAVAKVRRIWASLPGAGYTQATRTPEFVRAAYAEAGGTFA